MRYCEQISKAARSGACPSASKIRRMHAGNPPPFDGKTFVRSEYGEEESVSVLATDDETLDCIRKFYDWESRKDSYPHRPPELEAWRFIQGQLI